MTLTLCEVKSGPDSVILAPLTGGLALAERVWASEVGLLALCEGADLALIEQELAVVKRQVDTRSVRGRDQAFQAQLLRRNFPLSSQPAKSSPDDNQSIDQPDLMALQS